MLYVMRESLYLASLKSRKERAGLGWKAIFRVSPERSMLGITRTVGYFPSLFHHFFVQQIFVGHFVKD